MPFHPDARVLAILEPLYAIAAVLTVGLVLTSGLVAPGCINEDGLPLREPR
jgi:hypothetical protein